jgi:hypothetical protein
MRNAHESWATTAYTFHLEELPYDYFDIIITLNLLQPFFAIKHNSNRTRSVRELSFETKFTIFLRQCLQEIREE